ncbi:MAG: hypothetical protein MUO76_01955, partial [Anaerolineaceae bacterium]|nr:hypothetical protein [Anaerolineaceae bacterium]
MVSIKNMRSTLAAPTSSVHLFKYQPEKIDVGQIYHYIKSNLDGTNPAKVSIYIASKSHIEVLKVEPESEVLAYVTADMNWENFSADHLLAWHILPDGKLSPQVVSALSVKDHTFTIWRGTAAYPAPVRHYPIHNYNFDFISLNFVFRHLIDPYQDFEIGIVEPNWDLVMSPGFDESGENSEVFLYTGKAKVEYLGDDIYRDVECHKYRISGKGLRDQEGFIWVNREKGYFENLEHPHPDNPVWDSLNMELQSTGFMSTGDWHKYIDDEREQKIRIYTEGKVNAALPDKKAVKTREQAWAEDIHFFVSKLEHDHPYLFHTIRPQDFSQAVSTLRESAASLEDHEIIVELGRILAM